MESHWSNRGFTSQWDILKKKNALLRRDVHDQQRKSGEEPTSLSFPDRRREHAGGPQRRRVTPRRRRGGHECRAGSRAFWPSLFVVAEVVVAEVVTARRRLPRPSLLLRGRPPRRAGPAAPLESRRHQRRTDEIAAARSPYETGPRSSQVVPAKLSRLSAQKSFAQPAVSRNA